MRGDDISGYHDVFDFGPRRHMHDSLCKLSQTVYLQARTVSTDADLHPLLGVAERIKLHETALQEAKSGKRDVRQMSDDILSISGEELPSRNVGSIGFVVHPSVVHLVDSHGSYHLRLAILRLRPLRQEPINIINCYSSTSVADESELDTGGSDPQRKVLLQIRVETPAQN